MPSKSVLIAAVLALSPAVSTAQNAPSFTPPTALDIAVANSSLQRLTAPALIQDQRPPSVRRAAHSETTDRQNEAATRHQQQVQLAEQVAPLMDRGECAQAVALARAHRDNGMANRVRQYCVQGVGVRAH